MNDKQKPGREVTHVPVTWLASSFASGLVGPWLAKLYVMLSSPPVPPGTGQIADLLTPFSSMVFDAMPGFVVGLVLFIGLLAAVRWRFPGMTRTQRDTVVLCCAVVFMVGMVLGLWLVHEPMPA